MPIKIFAAPSRYIQCNGEIENLSHFVSCYGKRFFAVADQFVLNLLSDKMEASFMIANLDIDFEEFKEEITSDEILRLLELFHENAWDAVIGIGGGKTLDAAKVIASKAGVPVIVIPTIASTNAASSAGSVIYNAKGEFESVYRSASNPNLVFVDVDIIAKAPVRMLVAGIGDAIAAFYEARACRASNADNLLKGKSTNTAFALVEQCDRILMADGLQAKISVENQVVNEALENVVEAILFLSGVGFESNGLSLAHAVAKGFTTVPGSEDYYHGELVAFGTFVQLILEQAPDYELRKVFAFMKSVGLPTSLENLGQGGIAKEELDRVSEIIANVPSTLNMPFEVRASDIANALLAAGDFGNEG